MWSIPVPSRTRRRYSKEYKSSNKNIKYLKTERETIYQAWNRGIKAAGGKYVTNANTDDRHRKDALEILANELDKDENIGLVYSDQYVTKTENQSFESREIIGQFDWPEFDRTQLIHCACVGPQPMWRRSLHDRFGYFNETLKVAGDYEWWLRISEYVKLKHIAQKLGLYLLSEGSVEHEMSDSMIKETIEIRKHFAARAGLNNLDYNKYKATFLTLIDSSQPLVSVIIPTYNRREKLVNAIKSTLSQTYQNFEVIVVNDGGENVSDIIKQLNDPRIKLITFSKHKGVSAARNAGIKATAGEYIALLDDDDLFYSDHLSTALNHLNEKHEVIYTRSVRISYREINGKYVQDSKTVPYSIEYDRNKLLVGNISPINCFVFKKSLTDKAGLFDESLPVLEDWEFWLRLSSFTDFKHIKKNTVQVNWYNDGSTLTSSKQKEFGEARNIIYKKYEDEINQIPNLNEIISEFNAIWNNDNKADSPKASIIALSYNQHEYTLHFIDSLLKYTNVPFEIIIIDNGSGKETVDSIKQIAENDERIKVVFNSENLGFPAGVNQGLKLASGNYVGNSQQ